MADLGSRKRGQSKSKVAALSNNSPLKDSEKSPGISP